MHRKRLTRSDHRAHATKLDGAVVRPRQTLSRTYEARKVAILTASCSACSIRSRCPAPGTISSSAPGIRAARMRALTDGTMGPRRR